MTLSFFKFQMIFKKPSATEDVSQWNFSFLKWATTAAYSTI